MAYDDIKAYRLLFKINDREAYQDVLVSDFFLEKVHGAAILRWKTDIMKSTAQRLGLRPHNQQYEIVSFIKLETPPPASVDKEMK